MNSGKIFVARRAKEGMEPRSRRVQLLVKPSLFSEMKKIASTKGISFNNLCEKIFIEYLEPDLPVFDLWAGDSVFQMLCREMHKAKTKHPDFADTGAEAVALIAEELGELAQVVNDQLEEPDMWRDRAMIEAAHVAVTAIRTMHMLKENS